MDVTNGNPEQVAIRPATLDDYPDIVGLWRSAGLPYRPTGRESETAYRAQLERCPDLYLVAESQGRVVGVVFGTQDGRKGWINRLAVDPSCRRLGIGLALATACDTAIRAQGIEIVAALIEPANEDSVALFEKLGYRSDVPVRYFRKLSRDDI